MRFKCMLMLVAFSSCLGIVNLQAQMQQATQLRCEVFAEGRPLEFAHVYIPEINRVEATDSLGTVLFEGVPAGTYTIEVSYVGCFKQQNTLTLRVGQQNAVKFQMTAQVLEEVVVTGSMREMRQSDSPIPIDVISAKLFMRNPSPNIFESVGMVSGVQPVLNCNVCNTGDVQINGIEGVYTQVLLDGMPIVSGLGTVYGLMGIPNSLIDRIEVVKGPAGTLYGSEAMAGQINIITKNPLNSPRLSFDMMGTSWGELNFDASASMKIGKNTSSLTGLNAFWYDHPIDRNEDGFTDVALQKRISLFNKWQWERRLNRLAQLGVRYVTEDRWGGQTNWTKKDRGGDQVYGESIYTNRLELFGNYQLPITLPIFVQASYNTHRQDSYYGDVRYDARQDIAFVQSYLDKELGRHRLLTGAAVRYTLYNDNTPATASPSRSALPGIFLQDEIRLGQKNNSMLSGIRMDWHTIHGLVWSPRIGLHFHTGERQGFRLSGGSGFRVVSLFTEDHAALSGAREVVILGELDPERSWSGNFSYDWQLPTDRFFLDLQATAFYTWFSNRILPDYDTDPQKIIYANLAGHSATRGATFHVDYSDGLPMRINAGITFMNVYTSNENGEKTRQIRAPKWSGVVMANYVHTPSGLNFDLTANWFGPQRLPVVPNDFRSEYSPWYAIVNLQLSRKFKHGFELYGGVKNVFNFVPGDPILRPFDPFDRFADDPVNNPYGYTFDPSYNYASLQGIRGFLGVRYSLYDK